MGTFEWLVRRKTSFCVGHKKVGFGGGEVPDRVLETKSGLSKIKKKNELGFELIQ